MNTLNWLSIQENNRDNIPVGSADLTAYVNAMLSDGTPIKVPLTDIIYSNGNDISQEILDYIQGAYEAASDHDTALSDHNIARQDHINTLLANELITLFGALSSNNVIRIASKIQNIPTTSAVANVAYDPLNNAGTYRVTNSGIALLPIVGLSVTCPPFGWEEGTIEKVMAIVFLPSTADFSLTLVREDGNIIDNIPWIDGVEPTWLVDKIYALIISSLGISVSYRIKSNLYNE